MKRNKKRRHAKFLTQLLRRLQQKNTLPETIKRSSPADEVYDMWLARIAQIEQIATGSNASLHLGFLLFPLMDSIATNLGYSFRRYAKSLGIEKPHLLYSMFRNGQLHNGETYVFEYENGEIIHWAIMSSSGSNGFRQYSPGYEDTDHPEYNQPADVVFSYEQLPNNEVHAILNLDRLAARLRYDIQKRKEQTQKAPPSK